MLGFTLRSERERERGGGGEREKMFPAATGASSRLVGSIHGDEPFKGERRISTGNVRGEIEMETLGYKGVKSLGQRQTVPPRSLKHKPGKAEAVVLGLVTARKAIFL